ncbi:cobalamin biosynthesis protein [Chloroflexota bacterium]
MDHLWLDAAALALALVLDVVLGEPPSVVHPVVYLGKLIGLLERRAPKSSHIIQFSYGLGVALALTAAAATAGYLLVIVTREFNSILYIVVAGFLLKTCFAVRGLGRAAIVVAKDLDADEIKQAQTDLSALVSRDTSNMGPNLVAAATIESVAENTSDSFVAPWLAFALFGLPGALAYRVVNTLDAMIGYRGKYEYLGKASARLDDVLNFIPARISALIIVAAGWLRRHSARRALIVMSKDGGVTESPNAGLPMAAMAGALGVTLEKEGHYRLGSDLRQPVAADIEESVRIMRLVAAVACCLTLSLLVVRHAV